MSQHDLDGAVRTVLRSIDDYLVLLREVELVMKPGWFQLASARYNLGPGSLSTASYPGVMEALARVNTRPSSSSPSFSLRLSDPEPDAPHARPAPASRSQAEIDESSSEFEYEEDQGPSTTRKSQEEDLQSLLAQLHLPTLAEGQEGEGDAAAKAKPEASQKKKKKEQSRVREIREIELQPPSRSASSTDVAATPSTSSAPSKPQEQPASAKPDSKARGKFAARSDPLHWFGYLAPPPLRQAQCTFKGVLPRLCELAALRTRILGEMERVAELRKAVIEAAVAGPSS